MVQEASAWQQETFAAEGAQVLLVDLDEQALVEACAEIGGNQVSYLVADVTSAQDNARMVETATERYGGVDIFGQCGY